MDTNLDLDAIKDYLPYATQMNMDNIKVGMLPGYDDIVNGIWFFFYDEEETKILVDELFNGITPESEEQQDGNNTTNGNEIDDI